MKFGKNLEKLVDVSDPEWGPFWINYKHLKKRIHDIVTEKSKEELSIHNLIKSSAEVEFFRMLRNELKKASDFFGATEQVYMLRQKRVQDSFAMLRQSRMTTDKGWTRLLMSCVKFYKDVLLLENFAIMNYCGFSKILKKHDKLTGCATREAFMRNIMSHQNFTKATRVGELLKSTENLFSELQKMENVVPLQDEERLFIDAIHELNFRASLLRKSESNLADEQMSEGSDTEDGSNTGGDSDLTLDSAIYAVMVMNAASNQRQQLSPVTAMNWVQATMAHPVDEPASLNPISTKKRSSDELQSSPGSESRVRETTASDSHKMSKHVK